MKKILYYIVLLMCFPLMSFSGHKYELAKHHYGEIETKDFRVLSVWAYKHFNLIRALDSEDTILVVALKSGQDEELVGKTMRDVKLREMTAFSIPYWEIHPIIAAFVCAGDTILLFNIEDPKRKKVFLQDSDAFEFKTYERVDSATSKISLKELMNASQQ